MRVFFQSIDSLVVVFQSDVFIVTTSDEGALDLEDEVEETLSRHVQESRQSLKTRLLQMKAMKI